MTENKRFTYENHKVKDNLTGEVHSSNMVSVNVLNALHEENEQLRKEKECDKQIFTKKRLHELLQQTQKENDHIKQTIKTMMENERTELGQSVLRQLQEAIK